MRRLRVGLALSVIAVMVVALPAQAGNPFAKARTTASGYHTWDSDLINIEDVSQSGSGVYVAVLDSGLVPNWSDYLPKARVATSLGIGFEQPVVFREKAHDPCGLEAVEGPMRKTTYIGSTGSTHGTHVASTIIGYSYRSNSDLAAGYPLPPIQVRGIAPNVTIIPVKVLADYQIPTLPKCTDHDVVTGRQVFGTDAMIIAGIDYVTNLKKTVLAGKPVVINMSLGGSELSTDEQRAIDEAVAAGVVIVAAAGNAGEDGMDFPGAYAPVISVGAAGWTGEWLDDGASGNPPTGSRYRMWWLQNVKGNGAGAAGSLQPPLKAGSGQTGDPTTADEVYVADFSSRDLGSGQDLDVLAPGSWVRGPFPGTPGFNHLPWWSKGIADLVGNNAGNFYFVGGTSMATPHVASVAALMLQADPSLSGAEIESILEETALPIPAGTRQVWDPFAVDAGGVPVPGFYPISWGDDANGSGLIQAADAIAAIP